MYVGFIFLGSDVELEKEMMCVTEKFPSAESECEFFLFLYLNCYFFMSQFLKDFQVDMFYLI